MAGNHYKSVLYGDFVIVNHDPISSIGFDSDWVDPQLLKKPIYLVTDYPLKNQLLIQVFIFQKGIPVLPDNPLGTVGPDNLGSH